MSLFEQTFNGYRELQDGTRQPLNPKTILQDRGPLLDVIVYVPDIVLKVDQETYVNTKSHLEGLALIDTGASVSAIDKDMAGKLSLNATGSRTVSHAGGSEEVDCYTVKFQFHELDDLSLDAVNILALDLKNKGSVSYVALIGRDLLQNMRFVYNGPAGRIEIAM